MAAPTMQPGEVVLARGSAQLARGFPQTAGELFLTDRRLVLVPSQLLSAGFGRVLEIPLARICDVRRHGRFQGGTFIGCAGRKIEVELDDGDRHTFSFYLGEDVDAFHAALERCRSGPPPVPMSVSTSVSTSAAGGAASARSFPRPRRTAMFWITVVGVAAGLGMIALAVRDIVSRW